MPIFPQSNLASHPCSNWLAIIAALTEDMPATDVSLEQLNECIFDVFRLLWITQALNAQSPQQVTNVQAAAVLAAWNTAYTATAVNLLTAIGQCASKLTTKWQSDSLKSANTDFLGILAL